uniref:Uncharacterized protein n=1 Tax=Arundo donax TaxID=35708 RepID=A0A0A9C800_ARUDO
MPKSCTVSRIKYNTESQKEEEILKFSWWKAQKAEYKRSFR